MFTAFLALSLVVALLLGFLRPRTGSCLLAVVLALFLLGADGVLPTWLITPLVNSCTRLQSPQWGRNNAIVLLGAGLVRQPGGVDPQPTILAYPRILEAVRLYQDCLASGKPCTLIISGGDPQGLGVSEAAVYGKAATGIGVRKADIILEARSLNTFQNAEFTSAITRSRAFDRTILVTSSLHMERSLLYFTHHGIRCEGSASDSLLPFRSWIPLGLNLALTDFAIHEHLGIIRFRMRSWLGWPAQVADRGGAS